MTDHAVMADTASCTTCTHYYHRSKAAVDQRQVHFGLEIQTEVIYYDANLTAEEKDLLWHDPDELRERSRNETLLARKIWKRHRGANVSNHSSSDFCVRGLEKRIRSSDAQRKKWYTFLRSFLELQQDLRRLESDATSLLGVFVGTHSKAEKAAAHQVALQDEAIAFGIYSESGSFASCTDGGAAAVHEGQLRQAFSKKLHLKNSPATGTEQPPQQQRSKMGGVRARSA